MSIIKTGLIYFDQAARDGSIRKAAKHLQVAASAVNRQLLQLENEFGVELFERLPHGIRPTAAGEAVLSYVRKWGQDVQHLRREIGHLKGATNGTIHIAAAESVTVEILPKIIIRVRQKYPQINFSIISGDNYYIKTALLAKDTDLVCAFDLTPTSRTETVSAIASRVGVIMPCGHPLAKKSSLSLAECAKYPLIAPTSGWLNHSILKDIIEEGRVPFDVAARVERIGMLKNLVSSGLGLGLMSAIGLETDILDRRLDWVPLDHDAVQATRISLLIPKGRLLPPYTRMFISELKAELERIQTDLEA